MADSFKAKASSDGVSLSASGAPAHALAGHLSDAISPITELLGLAGDEVGRLREKRKRAVERAAIRAQELREARQIKDKPVDYKVLINWFDGVSKEDIDQDNILEFWSNIIASEQDNLSPLLLDVIAVCQQIDPRSARFLVSDAFNVKGHPVEISRKHDLLTENPQLIKKYFTQMEERHGQLLDQVPRNTMNHVDRDFIFECAQKLSENIFGVIGDFIIGRTSGGALGLNFPLSIDRSHCIALHRLGLLDRVDYKWTNSSTYTELSYYEISSFGFDFIKVVQPTHFAGVF